MSQFENPKYSSNRSFQDFMFILVCCLTLFFVLTLIQILKNNEGIVHKAEFILTMTWPKDDDNDMDLWLKDPHGNIIYYKDKEVASMFLDRDDLGHQNDEIVINGVKQIIEINQEIISVRAIIPGRWVVAVHFYKRHDKKPPGTEIPVVVRMDKINPKIQIIFNEELNMQYTWEEQTVAIFEILPDGTVTNIRLDGSMPMVHERIPVPVWGPDHDGDGEPEDTSQGIPGGSALGTSHPGDMTEGEARRQRQMQQPDYSDPLGSDGTLGDEEFEPNYSGGV